MSQRHNGNTKRSNPKENQLGISKIYAFYWNIQQVALDPGVSFAGIRYVSMRIHPKVVASSQAKNYFNFT